METYYSHGKLLISGEYLVLDGALAFAIPTTFGQKLTVSSNNQGRINWTSLDSENKPWYTAAFNYENGKLTSESGDDISARLMQILNTARRLNPDFLKYEKGYDITTKLEFKRDWGLGSSSTLLNNIAEWAKVSPFALSDLTFGGSGYDIACAMSNSPILYKQNDGLREVKPVKFKPGFESNLYFLHLGIKQNSREAIASYRQNGNVSRETIKLVSELSEKMAGSNSLESFAELIDQHEQLLSGILKLTPVKQRLFPDFEGSIKSLGAWGGDFVLVVSEDDPGPYFSRKGYHTLVPFTEMILK